MCVLLTKYSNPTMFGLKNARSANALACFVRFQTLCRLRFPPSKASSNNRTASSTSPTTSLPTRISWIRATSRSIDVSVASASAAVARICVRRSAAICHAFGAALSAGAWSREDGDGGTPRSSSKSSANTRNAARTCSVARDPFPDGYAGMTTLPNCGILKVDMGGMASMLNQREPALLCWRLTLCIRDCVFQYQRPSVRSRNE